MHEFARRIRGRVIALAVITTAAACGESSSPAAPRALAVRATAPAAAVAPELGGCGKLAAPEGSVLAFHTYAAGVQIYRWTGATWAFVAPDATLFADAAGHGVVGTHYAGPTWASNSGALVVGTVRERCAVDPTAIPWLLLDAVATGPGVFQGVDLVQRVNTVGGIAPAAPGQTVGEEARVPYTAEYYFWRAP